MKKLFVLAAAAFLTLSCSDDDSNPTTSASVEGTWKLTAFNVNEAVDINDDGTASVDFISETGCYNNSNIVFSGNNVATLSIQELDIELDLVIGTEDSYEYSIDCVDATPEVATYSVSGNSVSVTSTYVEDGVTETETIVMTKSNNTLTVTIPAFTSVPTEENGDIIYTFVGATLVFTKQ